MMDDMSRSIADLSEEMRLLRQSLVVKEGNTHPQCPPSEGSHFSRTGSSSGFPGPSTGSDTTSCGGSDMTTNHHSSSTTDEGSPVSQKEGEGSQYSSFDFYSSSSAENPCSDPSPEPLVNDISEPTNPSLSEQEGTVTENVPVQEEAHEAESHPSEMFQSADDISRFQKDLRNGLNSQFGKDSDIDELLSQLSSMGYSNSVFNKVLLQQNNCNFSQTIDRLEVILHKIMRSIERNEKVFSFLLSLR
eukprot:TRINITY_DN1357_c0_g1_i1.p1 TRINITY_DN1357_c0_g1~~TRINITY_DN1357_c0_g1_i1.p1  ORF type:complete len:246 (-),score=45.32 TRINITY_DN1357_c0_g1_i1:173-910(-)